MLTITIICIGRLKDAFFEAASKEYLKRLGAYAKVNIVELKAVDLPQEPSAAEISAALEKEGAEILKKIPAGFQDFARNVFPKIPGQIYAKVMRGYWSDIGTLLSYYSTNYHVAENALLVSK